MKYRPEIDGLRALAVVPIILLHTGFELFSGGFVGVDVFFVISGYLITTILIEDIENKRFSIVNFYEKRARRILPALFFVMLACIPLGYFLLLPDELQNFGQSLFATTLFSNNILLSITTDYWQIEGAFKPLLHTWSLGVEEQYYLLFPIFLILAWRFGKNRVFWIIVILTATSLLLSEWGWRNQPKANFYLLPTRCWEIFIGSIAAFIVQSRGVQKNNALAFFGLAAIVFSIVVYDKSTPFPSLYALVPVLGTVLIVLNAHKDTTVAKLLSTKVFVGMGLISYSAYLWHQPLVAFTKSGSYGPISNYSKYLLILLILFFSLFTYHFIEQTYRKQGLIKTKNFLISVFIAGLIILSTGLWWHSTEGNAKKFYGETMYGSNKIWRNYNESYHKSFIDESFTENNQESDRKKLLIIGSSYGRDLANALGEAGILKKVSFMFKSDSEDGFDTCSLVNNPLPIEVLVSDIVVFGFTEAISYLERDTKCSARLIDRLTDLGKVSYFAGYKSFGSNLGWLKLKTRNSKIILECGWRQGLEIEANIHFMHEIDNINRLDIQAMFSCNEGSGVTVTDNHGKLLSVDRIHLTSYGAKYLGKSLVESNHSLINHLKN